MVASRGNHLFIFTLLVVVVVVQSLLFIGAPTSCSHLMVVSKSGEC